VDPFAKESLNWEFRIHHSSLPTMLSIVIPVLNEAESLEPLHRELAEVAAAEAYEMEIIFVDDGSSDGSWETIRRLAERDSRVQGIRFRRNFGKAAALSAGFAQARGELLITLDADLQDDPREIPRFLAAMERDLDCVSGWKKIRRDPWHKVFPSRVFNVLVSSLTGVRLHDHNCGMKCYRREIFDEVQLYGELHRFVPVLAASRGYRVGEIEINHRPRQHGRSKYGLARFLKGFLDLLTVKFLTGFGQRPQHVLGAAGLLFFSLGLMGLFYLAGQWIVTRWVPGLEPRNIHERALMYYSIASLLVGGQFMSIGFLAELFIAYHYPRMKPFSIRERIGGPATEQMDDEAKAKIAGD
jgi:glycosyltransferase involved in cell wall biosynthesis